jgi:hypothetical protein
MTAFNVVRFRVKPSCEERFIEAHRKARIVFKGFLGGWLIKTGFQTFCMIGHWRNLKNLADARPQMIEILNSFRDTLDDLGGGLGVTDPVSGEAVMKLSGERRPKKRAVAVRGKTKRASENRARV